uniref:Uncharacterized protein n=1 Tax=Davidia involucrata TaxID=16924 RepID=A0A5B7BHM8_DAVIN
MAAARLMLRTCRPPLGLHLPPSPISSSSFGSSALPSNMIIRCRCLSKTGMNGDERRTTGRDGERKPPVLSVKASVAASETTVITSDRQTNRMVVDHLLAYLLANVTKTALMILKLATKRRPWKLHAQMFIERIIIDCRFFTLFAVAGSLLGSVLCFVEGCFIILESYFQYFHALSQRSDQGHVVQLLIEAIDMFLVGTAMLIFGMGLHVMFVGSKHLKGKGPQLPGSNFFGLFNLKTLPTWIGMKSVTQAKSKIGHAMMMILQVGVLDKFKSIPLVTGFDLACFAGAVFVSSACIFLLSRLSIADR